MKRLIKSQHGDTIVEVLLSITVLSAVLAVTYSLATRAFRTLQIAREQMQATLIAQEQLEAVISIHRAVNGIVPGVSQFRAAFETDCSGAPIATYGTPGTSFLMVEQSGSWCVRPAGPHPDFGSLYQVANQLDYILDAGSPVGVDVTSTVSWQEIGTTTTRDQSVTTRLR